MGSARERRPPAVAAQVRIEPANGPELPRPRAEMPVHSLDSLGAHRDRRVEARGAKGGDEDREEPDGNSHARGDDERQQVVAFDSVKSAF